MNTDVMCQQVSAGRKTFREDPTLLRGVHPSELLARGAELIRVRPDFTRAMTDEEAEVLYAKSTVVEALSSFLSHSWHASNNAKAAALVVHYNGKPALCVAVVVALLMALADQLGALPVLNPSMDNAYLQLFLPGVPSIVRSRSWSFWGYIVVYNVTLAYWQSWLRWLGRSNQTVFFDRLCIHQSNPQRKAAGVRGLGTFLMYSKEMLIMWDKTYFQRLWCTYELAIFLGSNDPEKTVNLQPIALGYFEFWGGIAGNLIILVGSCLSHFGAFGFLSTMFYGMGMSTIGVIFALHLFLAWVFFFLCARVLRNFEYSRADLLHLLDTFSADNCLCAYESDRSFVVDNIQKLYGSVDDFNEVVRKEIGAKIRSEASSSLTIRYSRVLAAVMPFGVHFILDDTWLILEDCTVHDKIFTTIMFAISFFGYFPIALKLLELITRAFIFERRPSRVNVACAAYSGFFSLLTCALFSSCKYIFVALSLPYLCILAAIVFLLTFMLYHPGFLQALCGTTEKQPAQAEAEWTVDI
eukprot:TRINITY_DN29389_c2_g4_i1.p1 TRINITY_DN29389_c2_g4~~TRINITY_DN29389_c2_g4_i1.p1  ORF type:complete len:553 (+),score=52.40 TRINITY_DN29389_c2_g4_i1:85-1659(+)